MAKANWLSLGGVGGGLIAFVVVSVGVCAGADEPGKLRYLAAEERTVAYRIEITADRDDCVETLEGIVTYQIKPGRHELIQADYSGGLSKSTKSKPSESPSRFGVSRFGPRMFGPSRALSPFSRPTFRGLTKTKNQVTLTSLGEIQSLEGDSQLPYLLGNASLLVFEALPEAEKESWSVTSGISITEEDGRRGLPYRMPFDTESPKRRTAGSEVVTYQTRSVEGPLVVVDKTYRLDSPAVNDRVCGFEINGLGTWVFNRELGVSESLDLKQKLVMSRKNTTTTIPMTLTYRRLSESELKVHQEEEKRKQEEAKQQLAEMKEKQANTPLTAKEIEKLLANLKSDNVSSVLMALQTLQNKNPKRPDPRIAMAVDSLRNHENTFVQQRVEKVAEKWPLPEGVLSVTDLKRTWSDSSGTFTVEAEFLGLEKDTVRLRRADGKELEVPLDQLSEADQKAARKLAEAPTPVIDNPFE